MVWDKEKIKTVLPQREPFLFIDEVIEIEGTDRAVISRNVSEDEHFFEGHFPGRPVMPGVILVEAMAQASIILYAVDRPHIADSHPDYYLGKIKAEFFRPVFPGDTMIIETRKVKFLDNAGITDSTVKVNDRVAAKANLVFSIQGK